MEPTVLMHFMLKINSNCIFNPFIMLKNYDYVLKNLFKQEKCRTVSCRDRPHMGLLLLPSQEAYDQMKFFELRKCTQYD